jgi:hypothetical protein
MPFPHPAFEAERTIGAPPAPSADADAYFAGYLDRMSCVAGDTLTAHVATRSSAPCHADVYRVVGCEGPSYNPALELVQRAPAELEPARYPARSDDLRLAPGESDTHGCGWPASGVVHVPEALPSGLYLVQFTGAASPTGRRSARLGQDALLAVRSPAPRSPVLLQLGVATWNAYHVWGRSSLYGALDADGGWHHELAARRVSFRRPGIGLGPFNQSLCGPGKGAYAFKFLEWARRAGLELDVCTGIDVHEGAIDLSPYRLLVTVGHDEYWTGPQRDAVERFVAGGGNAAFFGGNLAYWQVRVEGDAVVCHKRAGAPPGTFSDTLGEPLDPLLPGPARGEVTVQWHTHPVDRPPTTLTGAGMRNDGDVATADPVTQGPCWWWEDVGGPERPRKGFTVCEPDHWAFAGTGVAAGAEFGAEQRIVGHECDGLDVELRDGRPHLTGRDAPLPGTEILAFADCRDWAEMEYSVSPPVRHPGRTLSRAALGGVATLLVVAPREGGGTIFNAPTTDWAFALVESLDYVQYRSLAPDVRPACAVAQRVTRNVLAELSRPRGG